MSEQLASFDFHLHTCWSYDATCPVETYFEMAEKLNVSHIAITEHHQMDSLPEVVAAAQKHPTVNYIPSAENLYSHKCKAGYPGSGSAKTAC